MKFLSCIFLVYPILVVGKIDFPSYVKICKRDEHITNCLKENFEKCRPHLKKGIPKLSIPSLDPLRVEKIGIDGNSFKIHTTNFTVKGLDDFVLHHVQPDFVNNTFLIDLSFPYVEMRGKYNIKGQILLFQLDGSGPLFINITNVHAKVIMSGVIVKRNGKEYVEYEKTKVNLNQLKRAYIYFGDLFANNAELTAQYNNAINTNIEDFMDALQPLIEEAIGELTQSIIQRMFHKYSLDELFPKL